MTVCVVCYSSNAFFRTSSDAAAFCFFWQLGGAIANEGSGSVVTITASKFEGNTAKYVSDGLCCVLFFKRFLSNLL